MRVLMGEQRHEHLLSMFSVKPGQLGRTAHPFLVISPLYRPIPL